MRAAAHPTWPWERRPRHAGREPAHGGARWWLHAARVRDGQQREESSNSLRSSPLKATRVTSTSRLRSRGLGAAQRIQARPRSEGWWCCCVRVRCNLCLAVLAVAVTRGGTYARRAGRMVMVAPQRPATTGSGLCGKRPGGSAPSTALVHPANGAAVPLSLVLSCVACCRCQERFLLLVCVYPTHMLARFPSASLLYSSPRFLLNHTQDLEAWSGLSGPWCASPATPAVPSSPSVLAAPLGTLAPPPCAGRPSARAQPSRTAPRAAHRPRRPADE